MSKVKDQTIHAIHLPADLSPASVSNFDDQIKNCLKRGMKEIRIDCSGIQQVSSGHVSLIWQAFEDCRQASAALIIESASDGLKRVLKTLDLSDILGVSGQAIEWNRKDEFKSINIETPQHFSDRIKISHQDLQISLGKFDSFLRSLGIPPKMEYELRTVFYEVVTNIYNYSGLGESAYIAFSTHADSAGIKLMFEDKGKMFDPTKQERTTDFASAAQKRQFRGFGLLMIKKMINEMQYTRTKDGYNQLSLLKRWRE